jgi:predicted ferric reductase
MFFIPSDVSNNLVLRYYMLAIAAVGAYSYVHRTILGIYKKGEYRYKLEKVIRMNDDVAELIFSPVSRKIKYLPGQFVYLRFEDKGILSESHPFSITSSNFEHNLSLGIKTVGDYTSMVYLLKPGRTCLIEGPFGVFSYLKTGARRQIWIAGGIGITPFLGMARQFDASKFSKDYKIDLYYSVKNSAEAAFLDEFTEISRKNDNFKFHPHFSSGSGHLSASIIVRNSKDISNADIFLCGPTSFMQTLKNQFLKLGFINKKIHSEEFNL